MKGIDVFDDGREKKVLVFVIKETPEGGKEILMGYHLKQEHMNFPGGGVEAGENPKDAAERELREETGLEGEELRQLGNMIFKFPNGHIVDLDVFVCRPIGEILQEHEGKEKGFRDLAYYDIDNLPFDGMWPTDKAWLEFAFEWDYFNGTYDFATNELHISKIPELRVV